MARVDKIEKEVRALSPEELAQFRSWFVEFDWDAWERQIERDVAAGKLDSMTQKALRDHASGRTNQVPI